MPITRTYVPSLPTATKKTFKNTQTSEKFIEKPVRRFVFCLFPIGEYNQDKAKKKTYQQAARRSAMNMPLPLSNPSFPSTTPVLSSTSSLVYVLCSSTFRMLYQARHAKYVLCSSALSCFTISAISA
jgi:hypothetical protein